MLRAALTVIGVLVVLLTVVVAGAMATGYLVVGDPGAAASQVLSGDFESPNVTVEETRIGPVGVPEGGIEEIDEDGATMSNRLRVENPNHLGGVVQVVEYDVYMSGDRDGEYDYVGNGTVRDLRVPPNGTATETNELEIGYEDLVAATGGAGLEGLVGGGTWYARIDGEAEIALGPASFTVEFEKVNEVGR